MLSMTREEFKSLKAFWGKAHHKQIEKEYFDEDEEPILELFFYPDELDCKSKDGKTSVYRKVDDYFVRHEGKWMACGRCINNIDFFENIVIAACTDDCTVYDPVTGKSKTWALC